uniref:Uncharacterized protein n=1 Tax=Aegilops tauschii subsp. strangulata TaxID=200361 RepID=A0A453EU13_AEGTS
ETHALFSSEDCQGNIEFEGWIMQRRIIGINKRNVQTGGKCMYLIECSYVFPGVPNARISEAQGFKPVILQGSSLKNSLQVNWLPQWMFLAQKAIS